jgi:hypothetical protein
VSKEEALEYLKLWKIKEEQAVQIYGLVGGHISNLQNIAHQTQEGKTFEGMCTVYYAGNGWFLTILQLYAKNCSTTPKE